MSKNKRASGKMLTVAAVEGVLKSWQE